MTAILKDVELQRYYDAMFDMHASRGWAELLADLAKMREVCANADNLNSAEELFFAKGQLNLIDQLLAHKAFTEAGFNAALEAEQGEERESTGGVAKVVGDAPAEPAAQ